MLPKLVLFGAEFVFFLVLKLVIFGGVRLKGTAKYCC